MRRRKQPDLEPTPVAPAPGRHLVVTATTPQEFAAILDRCHGEGWELSDFSTSLFNSAGGTTYTGIMRPRDRTAARQPDRLTFVAGDTAADPGPVPLTLRDRQDMAAAGITDKQIADYERRRAVAGIGT